MNWLTLLPQIISLGPNALADIQSAWNITISNAGFKSKLTSLLTGPILHALENEAAALFPKAAPELHLVGAAIAAFNPDYTRWLQGALNALSPTLGLPNPNLVVDGIYGKHTRDAVEAVQKHFGITIDGLAGTITQGWIAGALSKLTEVA